MIHHLNDHEKQELKQANDLLREITKDHCHT